MYGKASRKSNMTAMLLGALALVAYPVGFADDAPVQVAGGTAGLPRGEDTDIGMESETVHIRLGKYTFAVDAVFEFFNYGDLVQMTVGFPRWGKGYAGWFKGVVPFLNFQSWVDDEPCDCLDMPGTIAVRDTGEMGGAWETTTFGDPEDIAGLLDGFRERKVDLPPGLFAEECRWFVKNVRFPGHAKTITRVRYEVPYHDDALYQDVYYCYGTGSSWRGNIGVARFVVESSSEIWDAGDPLFGSSPGGRRYRVERLSEYEHQYVLEDVEPEPGEELIVFASNTFHPWESFGEFEYEDRLVDEALLHMLSLKQLCLLRNAFTARHGGPIDDAEAEDFFVRKRGYVRRSDYRESDLSDLDRKNIRIVGECEANLRNSIGEQRQ